MKKICRSITRPSPSFSWMLLAGAVILAAYHIVIGALLSIPGADIVKASAMQLFGILLPGGAVYLLLYRKEQSFLGALFLSYCFGYIANIVGYFLLVPFGLQQLVPVFVVLLAAASVFVILRYGNCGKIVPLCKGDIPFILLFLAFLVFNTILYSGLTLSPDIRNISYIATDQLFWLENTSALVRQFPPVESRLSVGKELYYHYFSSIQLAFSNLATGVDCFTLSFPLFSVGKSLLFFGGFYVLLRGLTKSPWLQALGLIAVCFSTGFEKITMPTYIGHIITAPFGFDIGLALGAFFLHCFYLQLDQPRLDWRILLLSVLTCAACTGAKAPVAVAVIAAAGIVCFAWLFQKKWTLAFSYGISLLAVFGLIAIFCVGLLGSSGESTMGGLSLWAFVDNKEFFASLRTRLGGILPNWILLPALTLLYTVMMNPLIFGIFLLACLFWLADKKMRTAQNLGLCFAGLLSLALGLFNVQNGNSQMYFAMSAVIPCIALVVQFLDTRRQVWDVPAKRINALLLSALLLLQLGCTVFLSNTYYGTGLVSAAIQGTRNLIYHDAVPYSFSIDGLQTPDLEALEWVRDNTPTDSVVLSDRCVLIDNSAYMYYGAFCERQMYLEGDIYYRERYVEERARRRELITAAYSGDMTALQTIIDDGVDYILQTVPLAPGFVPDASLAKLVYSSASINVYEVIH